MIGFAASLVVSDEAKAFVEGPLTDPESCSVCIGSGYQRCLMCRGTGQFQTSGNRGPGAPLQFLTCPSCLGAGLNVCQNCRGTGMNKEDLRGFLRDPAFRKVTLRLGTYDSVNLGTLVDFQKDVAEAKAMRLARIKEQKEKEAAADAAQTS